MASKATHSACQHCEHFLTPLETTEKEDEFSDPCGFSHGILRPLHRKLLFYDVLPHGCEVALVVLVFVFATFFDYSQ